MDINFKLIILAGVLAVVISLFIHRKSKNSIEKTNQTLELINGLLFRVVFLLVFALAMMLIVSGHLHH